MEQRVVPFLMFASGAQEAAEFYVSIFPDGKLLRTDGAGVSFEAAAEGGD